MDVSHSQGEIADPLVIINGKNGLNSMLLFIR